MTVQALQAVSDFVGEFFSLLNMTFTQPKTPTFSKSYGSFQDQQAGHLNIEPIFLLHSCNLTLKNIGYL